MIGIGESVVVVDGSKAVESVSGADECDDDATNTMNCDVQMLPVDQQTASTCTEVVMDAGGEEDGTGADDRGTASTCKFNVGVDTNQAHTDEQVVEDATGNHPQETELGAADTVDCARLGNFDHVEHEQVPETTGRCSEEKSADLREDLGTDESFPKGVVVEEAALPDYEMCSDDADDDDDSDDAVEVAETFYDAECVDHDCENDEGACCDSVSDSVSFENNSEHVDDVLPESQSDSMLNRLPVVQELSDSGSEDVVMQHSAGDLLAVSPVISSPTSPTGVSNHATAAHKRSASSPSSSSKPPPGAVVLRKSLKSDSADRSPKSPEYAGHQVELRPAKMTTRVSSFRRSLIK